MVVFEDGDPLLAVFSVDLVLFHCFVLNCLFSPQGGHDLGFFFIGMKFSSYCCPLFFLSQRVWMSGLFSCACVLYVVLFESDEMALRVVCSYPPCCIAMQ